MKEKMMKREVSQAVKERVRKYLEEHDLGELVEVKFASIYPADDYLYHVIARKKNVSKMFHGGEYTYSCFTSWNDKRESLNFGHYNLQTLKQAREICNSFFNGAD